jgi:hypothetical protein
MQSLAAAPFMPSIHLLRGGIPEPKRTVTALPTHRNPTVVGKAELRSIAAESPVLPLRFTPIVRKLLVPIIAISDSYS